MTIEEIIEKATVVLAEEFEIEESDITPDASLKDTLGLDSLDLVDVVVNEDEREFRGVWVSALVSDVPRYQSKSQYQKAITNVLDNMEKYNFNTLVFHIRIYNDAFYESQYCNYSSPYLKMQG